MANELRHADVGTALSKSEWEATGGHILNSQAAGDIIYASSTSQLTRLGIGAAYQFLTTNSSGNAPEWSSSPRIVTAITPDAADGATLGTAALEWSDLYLADGGVAYFGNDQDVSLTHVADAGLLLNSDNYITFRDSALKIYSSADGQLDIDADTEVEITATTIDIDGAVNISGAITVQTGIIPDAADGAYLGSTSAEWSDLFLADGAVINFGNDQDVSLTHVADTGLLMSSTDKLQFGDSGTFIHQSSDGVLTITSDTTVDVNGAVAFDGALTGITDITLSGALSDGNYTFDTSGNVSGLGTVGSGNITSSGTVQGTVITATTGFAPDASDGAYLGTASLQFTDLYLADGAVINLGDDQDVTLTHVADAGILINSDNYITFRDSALKIHSSADGQLDIDADTELEITAPTVDIDASTELNISADLKVGDDLSLTTDASVFNMGVDNDFTITHDGTAGGVLAGTPITINSTGDLTIDSTTDIILDADGADVLFKDGGSTVATIRNNGSTTGEIRLYESANYVGFRAPALSADQVWLLPTADGSTGQMLSTDGSGALSWASAGGAGTAIAMALIFG